MVRLLFFILTAGFVMQSSGATSFIKKPIEQTEQMLDDTPKEEKGSAENKKEQDKISGHEYIEIGLMQSLYGQFENIQLYPSGAYSKPFLPPRY